jgi:hypothetical protein
MSSVMDFLVNNCVENLPPKALGEVFDRLIWCLSDNGAGIHEVIRKWLTGNDLFRVQVALAMDEAFPYETREEMVVNFEKIIKKWSFLEERCSQIIYEWDKQFNK